MNDPTNSRYRYLNFRSTGTYRRFIQEEKNLQQFDLTYQDQDIPAHGTYGALLFTKEWKNKRLEILKKDVIVV